MPIPPKYKFILSPREVEVLKLFVEGKTTREIAATLKVSPSTVEGHSQKILEKAGVNRRKDAIAIADKLIKESENASD